MLKKTVYSLPLGGIPRALKIAVASDLHGNDPSGVLALLREEAPDLILIPGDIMDDAELRDKSSRGWAFLCGCASIAPSFYSLGNHEIGCYHKGNPFRHPTPVDIPAELGEELKSIGVTLLDGDFAEWNGLTLCGIRSGINGSRNEPDRAALSAFGKLEKPKILLCHHPEYYPRSLKDQGFDLIVSGHAHGGHWRIFGIPVYAPGQGLFPRLASGIRDGVLVISRGLGNHTRIPRIGNAPELVILRIGPML